MALILAWLKEMGAMMTRPESRGCPTVNAAVELPDQIHMLVEGAGVCLQSVDPDGPRHRLARTVESLLESADKAPRRR